MSDETQQLAIAVGAVAAMVGMFMLHLRRIATARAYCAAAQHKVDRMGFCIEQLVEALQLAMPIVFASIDAGRDERGHANEDLDEWKAAEAIKRALERAEEAVR